MELLGGVVALLAGPFALVRTSETPEAKIDNLAEAMGDKTRAGLRREVRG